MDENGFRPFSILHSSFSISWLLVGLLASLALKPLGLTLGLHLLVIDRVAETLLQVALQLLARAAHALGGLGRLLASLALEPLGLALGLHLLVIDQVAETL